MNKVCVHCNSPFSGHFNAKLCSARCHLEWRQNYSKGYNPGYRERHRKPQPEREPIPPFPDDVDREAFGHWLSGFCDGESTFGMRVGQMYDRSKPRTNRTTWFRIALRDDDTELLQLIRSYLECGIMCFHDNVRSTSNANPSATFSVQAVSDLMTIVIPHFERFPLRSKKRHDFAIWRQGVELMAEIQSRPIIGRLALGGIMPRWTDEDREKFDSLRDLLTDQRGYKC